MEAYTGFAQVYDIFMDDTPYEEWCGYLTGVLEKYQESGSAGAAGTAVPKTGNNYIIETDDDVIKNNLQQEHNSILDLGCGTGTLTELLARQGYDMIGIDNAQEMLQIAMDKRDASGLDILYLLQDMRELELYSTVGTVLSVCDSLNYLLEEKELLQVFRLVDNYLYPGGLFLFDFNTVYKYSQVIGDAVIAENREDCSFIWENYYHEEEEINEYDLTVFVQEEGDRFRRFTENHFQRGYTPETMRRLVEQAGMRLLRLLDADTLGEVTDRSERVYVLARECRKTPESAR